ncbi:MAG TPA: hypothetical protein PKD73_01530, partial [Burkholderiaceae bacterium]|nr:hypothetical protein [Burkholderiaceae bacterium]
MKKQEPAQRLAAIRTLQGFPAAARLSALSMACALSMSVVSVEAQALSLGRLQVRSALGEPLRAEIDVRDVTPDEASSLRVNLASPEVFRAAGIEYPAALNGLQVQLQRRANGQSVLVLTGARPVNEPFLDLILEAGWSTGRVVRDYTALLDPPPPGASPQVAAAPAASA